MIYLIIEMYAYTLKMFMEAYTSLQILLNSCTRGDCGNDHI